MRGDRTTPRTIRAINESLCLVMQHARSDCKCVHLIPCDFEIVKATPGQFNCIMQSDGTLQTMFRGHMISVFAVL